MHNGKPRSLKVNNRQRVLALLRQQSLLTAAATAENAGLSKTTAMKILDHFVAEGLVLDAGKGDSTAEGGKPPALFKLNDHYACAIGIHLFPEKIAAIAVDLQETILEAVAIPIQENAPLAVVVAGMAEMVSQLLQKTDFLRQQVAGIGIALPGVINPQTGLCRFSPRFSSWGTDADVIGPLRQKLGQDIPIFIDNESRLMAFAEKKQGAARDKRNIVTVSAGRGLAAGIIVNDALKHGTHNLAGEIGHMVINPYSRETCVCGGQGCFEVMVSTRRLLRKAAQGRNAHPESLIFSPCPETKITPEMIFQAADHGDLFARELLDDMAFWMSVGFSNLIMMHDPEVIVIQGIYTQSGDTFLQTLKQKTNRLVLKKIDKHVEIRFSAFDTEAGNIGAATYVIDQYFNHYCDLQTDCKPMALSGQA